MQTRMHAVRSVIAVLAVAAALASCSTVVSGAGSVGQSGRRASPAPTGGAPTGSTPSVPAPATEVPRPTPCPHVEYPGAHLRFGCIRTGLRAAYGGTVWPFSEYRTVERSTGWVLEEGAGHWGSPEGATLADIARNVRQQMIDNEGYGVGPAVHTVADRAIRVDGAPAHLLQTTFTINRAWARRAGTKVEQEKLWILAIRVGPNDVSLWYASIPDLAKSLWPKVPATIRSIQVG